MSFLLLACSEPSLSPLEQPVVLSNNATVSIFYNVIGLKISYLVDPAPTIPLGSHKLPELKSGEQVSLQPVEAYEKEGGICVFPYQIRSIEGITMLHLTKIRQVTYEELKTGKPIMLQ